MIIPCFLSGYAASAADPDASAVKIATWNVHGGDKADQIEKEIAGPLGDADVICLQEAGAPQAELAKKYGYAVVNSSAIVSRLPIVAYGEVTLVESPHRGATWADIRLRSGAVLRVYSPHLTFKKGKNLFIGKERGEEMRKLLQHARGFHGPVAIAGDLNSIFGERSAVEAARDQGFDVATSKGSTYAHVLGQLDWILQKGLKTQSSERGQFAGSDHRWITATLKEAAPPAPKTAKTAVFPSGSSITDQVLAGGDSY